jgi:hypothetical protein
MDGSSVDDLWLLSLREVSKARLEFDFVLKQYLLLEEKDVPRQVKSIRRLKKDIESLIMMIQLASPPLRLVRGTLLSHILYGFGNISGFLLWPVVGGQRMTAVHFGVCFEHHDHKKEL